MKNIKQNKSLDFSDLVFRKLKSYISVISNLFSVISSLSRNLFKSKTKTSVTAKNSKNLSGIYKILKEKLFNIIQGRFLFSKEGHSISVISNEVRNLLKIKTTKSVISSLSRNLFKNNTPVILSKQSEAKYPFKSILMEIKLLGKNIFGNLSFKGYSKRDSSLHSEGQENILKTKDYKLKTTSSKSLSFYVSKFLNSNNLNSNKLTNSLNPKTKNYQLKTTFGFTLVELIVVITILAILGTIAFVSFKNYSSSSRDSKRIVNVATIAKGIDMNISMGKGFNFSEVGTGMNVVILGSGGISFTGYYENSIGPKFLSSIGVSGQDLLNDSFQTYKFTFIPSKNYYQVMGLLENQVGSAYIQNTVNQLLSNELFAVDTNSGYAFIKGNFPVNTASGGYIQGIIPVQNVYDSSYNTSSGYAIIDGTSTGSMIIAAASATSGGGGGSVSYSNCNSTTYSGYTITALNHLQSQSFTKTISYGTGTITATCNNGSLSYGSENVSCTTGYVSQGGSCVADVCNGTVPTNATSNATSQNISTSWIYNNTPGVCTFSCNSGYVWSGGLNQCIVGASCTVSPFGTITHLGTVTAYQTASVLSPSTCTSETRTCNNGTLGGSYTNASCKVCPTGTTYNSGNGKCEANPTCTSGSYDSTNNNCLVSGSYAATSINIYCNIGITGWWSAPVHGYGCTSTYTAPLTTPIVTRPSSSFIGISYRHNYYGQGVNPMAYISPVQTSDFNVAISASWTEAYNA